MGTQLSGHICVGIGRPSTSRPGTGASLECETCQDQGNSCSGSEENCGAGEDTCLTLVFEGTVGGQTATGIMKRCYATEACNLLKNLTTFTIGGVSGTIKEVTCKAPSPSASLLLALAGLLLLKVLL
ncbi:UNVERIFIED_CONTAM: hypothetical protein K2H54_038664 [Gekko kuhli]